MCRCVSNNWLARSLHHQNRSDCLWAIWSLRASTGRPFRDIHYDHVYSIRIMVGGSHTYNIMLPPLFSVTDSIDSIWEWLHRGGLRRMVRQHQFGWRLSFSRRCLSYQLVCQIWYVGNSGWNMVGFSHRRSSCALGSIRCTTRSLRGPPKASCELCLQLVAKSAATCAC